MRIISGMRRGMKLKALDGLNTRPTTDRVKESVFNIIQFAIPCGSVLDLFSGSGALGIEAISRGCDHCVFVDSQKSAIDIVRENLSSAKFMDKAEIHNSEAEIYLKSCNKSFDIIFLDPPYNKGFLEPVLRLIYEKKLLNDDGIIVIETEFGGERVPADYYKVRKTAKYGKTAVTILQE